jgi:ATP-dependent Lon protease
MSGLMKIIFPNNDASKEEIAQLLTFAVEGRKRVKDQIMRFDHT